MRRKLVLELNELPLRAEKLNPNQIKKVFGGCSSEGEICFKQSDCCEYSTNLVLVCTVKFKCGGYYTSE